MNQFSKVKLLLSAALVCFGSAALAAIDPIPGVDIIVKKNPGGSIVVIHSDNSGRFAAQVKQPGNYTLSILCKSSACKSSQLQINLPDVKQNVSADGSTSYEFTVNQGSPVNLSGQALSLDLPKGSGKTSSAKITENTNPTPQDKDRPLMISDQAQGGVLTSYGIGSPAKDGGKGIGKGGGKDVPPLQAGDPIPGTVVGIEHDPDDEKVGISTSGKAGGVLTSPAAISPVKGVGGGIGRDVPQPQAGDPILGISVGLDHEPGGEKVGISTSGPGGAFNFSHLQPGTYKLTIPGMPDQSAVVGPEGKIGGNLLQGSNGEMSIFDRWGNMRGAGVSVPLPAAETNSSMQEVSTTRKRGIKNPDNSHQPGREEPKNTPDGFGSGGPSGPGAPDVGGMLPGGPVGSGPMGAAGGLGPMGGPGMGTGGMKP